MRCKRISAAAASSAEAPVACETVAEACRIVRPLLSLIESKSNSSVDYAGLLNDLLWFGHADSQTRIKARWAQSFYGKNTVEEEA